MHANDESNPVRVSVVIIGLNESEHLPACFESVRIAREAGLIGEVIYADSGSSDGSIGIAEAAGANAVAITTSRRNAATSRNAGWRIAQGEYVQFLDGDMTLEPDWIQAATDYLNDHEDCAVVCGHVSERSTSVWAQAMALDWRRTPGPVAYCGGAALYRKEVLDRTGGFPEDIPYGEEPFLCWRIRNELDMRIENLDTPMVSHHLAFRGFGDYWRRCLRVGTTYADVAARSSDSTDPLWQRERQQHLVWCVAIFVTIMGIAFGPMPMRLGLAILALLVLTRKSIQVMAQGYPPQVAMLYALHTYFAKIPLGIGIVLRWIQTPPDAYSE